MMKCHAWTLILSASAVLAGCAVGPQYAKPVTPPIALASRHTEEFNAAERPAPWWTFFDEQRLTQLIDTALAHNHDIREAQANLQASRAVFDERNLDRLPAVIARADYQRGIAQQADANGEPERRLSETWRAGFDAQWEIDLFGRLNRLSQSAQARSEAAKAELDLIRLTIAADVARAYYEGQGLERRLEVAQAQARSWQETLTLVQARAALGSGSPEDLENARANLLRSEATIAPLSVALQQMRFRLDVLTGHRPGHNTVEANAPSPAPLAKQLPLGDVDSLIRNRPDVVRAERLLASSTEDVGAATAELYPRLNLGGFIGFFALRGVDFGSGSRAFEIAPSVRWPALRLGSTRARLRGSQALSDGALARYEQSLLRAQEDVEHAVTQLTLQQSRLASLLQSASHGAAALDIAMKRYRAGSGSYMAVLENQRALFEIQQELAQAETASYVHIIALYKALGWGTGSRAATPVVALRSGRESATAGAPDLSE
jgi:multidrug efflux system outer membrane protein